MSETRLPNGPPGGPPEERTQTLYGWNACWAVFAHRAGDIRRIFHTRERRRDLAPVLKWAAAQRIAYRELDEAGMRKVSGATHHEGVAMSVAPRLYAEPGPAPAGDAVWLALDGVDNPYNVGAILRSAAFFGAEGVLVGGPAPGERVNAAALRAAEGGAEALQLGATNDLPAVLGAWAGAGVTAIGLEADGAAGWGEAPLPRPLVLVLGHEQRGLSPGVRGACNRVLAIPGGGGVGSLNVSVTAGVALAEAYRGDRRR